MAASDKRRKTKQTWSPSTGLARQSRANKAVVRTKSKIKRWKRYQREQQEGKRPIDEKNPNRWNIEGLESHLKNLQTIIKQGKSF